MLCESRGFSWPPSCRSRAYISHIVGAHWRQVFVSAHFVKARQPVLPNHTALFVPSALFYLPWVWHRDLQATLCELSRYLMFTVEQAFATAVGPGKDSEQVLWRGSMASPTWITHCMTPCRATLQLLRCSCWLLSSWGEPRGSSPRSRERRGRVAFFLEHHPHQAQERSLEARMGKVPNAEQV